MPKIKVDKILQLLDPESNVVIIFTAYGQHYADTVHDNIETAGQALEELNYTCRNAYVTKLDFNQYRLLIRAELVK